MSNPRSEHWKANFATEYLDTFIKASLKVYGDLNGGFVPPDKLADQIIDACAAHAQRLIKFFAGRRDCNGK